MRSKVWRPEPHSVKVQVGYYTGWHEQGPSTTSMASSRIKGPGTSACWFEQCLTCLCCGSAAGPVRVHLAGYQIPTGLLELKHSLDSSKEFAIVLDLDETLVSCRTSEMLNKEIQDMTRSMWAPVAASLLSSNLSSQACQSRGHPRLSRLPDLYHRPLQFTTDDDLLDL